MTQSEEQLLIQLGFKKSRLYLGNKYDKVYTLNNYIVTKHSYYWNVRGNFSYKLCKTYEDDKDIRFNGSGNSAYDFARCEELSKFTQDKIDRMIVDEITYSDIEKLYTEYKESTIDTLDYYIEDLHIDSDKAFVRVAKDIKNLNLKMEW